MSKEKGADTSSAPQQTEQQGIADPTLNWDDSALVSSYANVCNVASSRDEVTLLFGTNQSWRADQQLVTVSLNERVMIHPRTAKRLAALLARVVSDYEERFGSLGDTPASASKH